MNRQSLSELLDQVRQGQIDIDQAIERLTQLPFESLGFAKIDHHRTLRCGFAEVIFCPGKTTGQVVAIFGRLAAIGENVLATRAEPDVFTAVHDQFDQAQCNELARTITLRQKPAQLGTGTIGIVSAGTSDLPVAEEARVTAEIMDQHTATFYDVGVAGLHRLLSHNDALRQMTVLVVAAGMEGALPSVVAGLVDAPVIAVPTSVGYGASFGGLAPLLTMLNSCASGVSVVNIDNGFGAGYLAARINSLADRSDRAAEHPG